MKDSKKLQAGWTTMEYIVGAIIIVGVVTAVITTVTGAISTQGTKLQQQIQGSGTQ
ncbi:MAG: hypothetical protein N2691_01500 [Patescibacteria group bacterium]|nr:hypothetical protein [Patescibacteria group bacterium]